MKILLMTDGANWIVDRISRKIAEQLTWHEFTLKSYSHIDSNTFVKLANEHDLVHYNNWDIQRHIPHLSKIKVPFLYTVRSFRYPSYTRNIANWATATLVINDGLLTHFPNSHYIPDGIFDEFLKPKKLKVGFAGIECDYKGTHIIKAACRIADCEYVHAYGIKPEDMVDWYKELDVYVCASKDEGFSTPVMECMALNIPVLTPFIGYPRHCNVTFYEPTVAGLVDELKRLNTYEQVKHLTWENICLKINELYHHITQLKHD